MGKILRPLLVLGAAMAVFAASLGGAAAQELQQANNAPTFRTNVQHIDFLAAKLIVGDNQTLVGPQFKADDADTSDSLTYTLTDTTSGSGHAAMFTIAADPNDSTRQQISRVADTPAGEYRININVDDGNGGTATKAVTVVVTSNSGWSQQEWGDQNPALLKLEAAVSNSVPCDPNSRFGNQIAATAEIIVVGAPRADGTPDCKTSGDDVPADDDVGAVYVFNRDTGAQLAKLTSPKPVSENNHANAPHSEVIQGFGWSVAADGDTIVVGSPHEYPDIRTGNSNHGFVYLYEKPDSGWGDTNTPTVTLTNTQIWTSANHFRTHWGYAVAIKGNTIVVGTRPEHWGQPFSEQAAERITWIGGMWVFTKPSSGDWADAHERSAVRLTPGSDFKHGGNNINERRPFLFSYHSIAISADEQTIVAGVPRHHADQRTRSGSGLSYDTSERLGAKLPSGDGGDFGWVYVFEKPSRGWATISNNTQVPRLVAKERIEDGYMGWDVAISDDGNTIVAGAPGRRDRTASTHLNYTGAAYVFTKPLGGWADKESDARLSATVANIGSRIGFAVDISGSGNRIALSHDASQGSGYRGSALVFDKPASGWATTNNPTSIITAADSLRDDAFGAQVHFTDESTLLIGQDGHADEHHINKGKTQGDTGRWSPSTGGVYLYRDVGPRFATHPMHVDFLQSKLIVGDNQTLVGPAFKATDADTASSALTYTLSDTTPGSGHAGRFSIAATSDDATRFQISRLTDTPAGNYEITVNANDGDGNVTTNDLTVVVTPNDNRWSQQAKLAAQTSSRVLCDPNSRFGYQIAATDEIIVVGAPRGDRNPDCMPDGDGPADNRDEGRVYVFDRTTGNQLARISSPSPISGQDHSRGLSSEDIQGFGFSVAVDEDTIVIGAPHETHGTDADNTHLGYVYIYQKPGGGWRNTSTPNAVISYADASHAETNQRVYFGYAVDIQNNTIAVTTNPTRAHLSRSPAPTRAELAETTGNSAGIYIFGKTPNSNWANTNTNTATKLTPGVDFKHTADNSRGRRPLRHGFTSVAISADENTIAAGAVDHYSDARTTIGTTPDFNPSQRLGARLVDRSDTGGNFGYVYLFEKPDSGWAAINENARVPRLVAKDRMAEAQMGYDIAITDNGDTIVAGAPGQQTQNYPGAAYVFTRPGSSWADKESDAKLTTTAANPQGLIGYAVDITPTGNRIAISHDGSQGSGYRGAALIYDKYPGGWTGTKTPTTIITAADSKADDTFGGEVHFADDQNLLIGQDGNPGAHFTALVNRGWPQTDTSRFGTSSGSIYHYQGPPPPTQPPPPPPTTGGGGNGGPPPPPPPPEPEPSDPVPGQCPQDQTLTFPDVNPGSTHKGGIDCVAALGITAGNTKGEFAPSKAVTRAQMATFLKRLWEKTGNTCPANTRTFPDVNPKSTHKPGIDCVAALQITAGNVAGNYQPNKPVTRSQMATFLSRLWKALPPPTP